MRLERRLMFALLMIWCGATYFARSAMAAQQVIVTVTGTVDSGTDGNPDSSPPGAGNVLGVGANLAGQPFTLTLTFDDSQGTNSFSSCSDGVLSQSSNTGSGPTAHPTALLQIGNGSYTFGKFTLQNIGWTIYRKARTSCSSYNDVSFGWSETYTGNYSGGAGFGSAGLGASDSAGFSGDWRSSITTTPVDPVDFQFKISVSQVSPPSLIAYASGYLKAATVLVVNECGSVRSASNSFDFSMNSDAIPDSIRTFAQRCICSANPPPQSTSAILVSRNGQPVIDPNTGQPYPAPPNMNISTNVLAGEAAHANDVTIPFMVATFRTGGPEDYQCPNGLLVSVICHEFLAQYTDVTFYNYGVVAEAAGLSLQDTLDAAGFFNQWFGNAQGTNEIGLRPNAVASITQGWNDQNMHLW